MEVRHCSKDAALSAFATVAFKSRDHLGLSCCYNRCSDLPQSQRQLVEVSLDLQSKLQPRVFPGQRGRIMVATSGSQKWEYCHVRLDEEVVDREVYVCISLMDPGLHSA